MSSNQDITTEKRSATGGADSRTESENHAARGSACDDDIIDMISHHNERWQRIDSEEEPEGMIPHT